MSELDNPAELGESGQAEPAIEQQAAGETSEAAPDSAGIPEGEIAAASSAGSGTLAEEDTAELPSPFAAPVAQPVASLETSAEASEVLPTESEGETAGGAGESSEPAAALSSEPAGTEAPAEVAEAEAPSAVPDEVAESEEPSAVAAAEPPVPEGPEPSEEVAGSEDAGAAAAEVAAEAAEDVSMVQSEAEPAEEAEPVEGEGPAEGADPAAATAPIEEAEHVAEAAGEPVEDVSAAVSEAEAEPAAEPQPVAETEAETAEEAEPVAAEELTAEAEPASETAPSEEAEPVAEPADETQPAASAGSAAEPEPVAEAGEAAAVSEVPVETPASVEANENGAQMAAAVAESGVEHDAADDEDTSTVPEPPKPAGVPGIDWYIIHTYSGFENKVKESLRTRSDAFGFTDRIGEILIPTEDVVEMRSGKKITSKRMLYPGYVLVQLKMDDELWHVVKNTPRVTGFVGSGPTPTPLTADEVNQILYRQTSSVEKPRPKMTFDKSDRVKIIDGPFTNFTGTVEEVNPDRNTLKVMVTIFGRGTPVELEHFQVEKERI